jgi:uncharacterized membrane protein YfcA
LTGVGGGSLMTPLLVLLFGVHPATAVGTDLLYASITKLGGSFVHGIYRTIDWRVTGRLAAGSLPAATLTLACLSWLGIAGENGSSVITTVLGAALILTAITLVFRNQIVEFAAARFGEPRPSQTARLTVLTGAALGVLVSISSVGAGAIGMTALVLLYPRLPMARLVGSDIAHAVPLTLLAGLGHLLTGSVDLSVLGALLLGSLPGIVVGSYAAAHVPAGFLRLTLAITLAIVGGRFVF